MPNFLFPTNATETLEQTLGNATIAANTSVETAQSVGYGVALTGASAIDAFTAKNTYSRCMFGVGYGLGALGTVSSALTAFNILRILSSPFGTGNFEKSGIVKPIFSTILAI